MTSKGAAKRDTPRVCAREGCDNDLPARRRLYCGDACRDQAKIDRRLARARAETAAELAATKAAVVEQVKEFYYLAGAAQLVGVSRSTVYRWLDTDPDFAAEVEIARRIASDMRELAVMHAAKTNPDALRGAVAVARRIDANELRRVRAGDRSNRQDRHDARDAPSAEIPAPQCDDALAWAKRPLLAAV